MQALPLSRWRNLLLSRGVSPVGEKFYITVVTAGIRNKLGTVLIPLARQDSALFMPDAA